MRVLVLEFVDDVGAHLHDVGDEVITNTMLHVLGIARTGQLRLDAPHVMLEFGDVEHGLDSCMDGLGRRGTALVGQHRQHGACQRPELHLRVVAHRVGFQQNEQFALVIEFHQSQQQGGNHQATGVDRQYVTVDAQFQGICVIGRQWESGPYSVEEFCL